VDVEQRLETLLRVLLRKKDFLMVQQFWARTWS